MLEMSSGLLVFHTLTLSIASLNSTIPWSHTDRISLERYLAAVDKSKLLVYQKRKTSVVLTNSHTFGFDKSLYEFLLQATGLPEEADKCSFDKFTHF